MTIELTTGTPGAGKTTYAVSQRVAAEAVRKLKMEDGTEYTRRVVAAGVRGLILEHEKLPHKLTGEVVSDAQVEFWNRMESGDAPKFQRLAGQDPVTEVLDEATGKMVPVVPLVQNWWLWAKPGDYIVVDEAQFLAPRGTLGKKPPYWIQALEIHRHYGVDFHFITQHPQLIDSTIRNLVGLHRHVRSVMGSALCMVYTWDHASNPERYQLANKGKFLRRAKHYRMFHSSVAHVKPPTSGRSILLVVPILVALVAFFNHKVSARFDQAKPVQPASAASAPAVPARHDPQAFAQATDLVSGCMAVGDSCSCVGKGGRPVLVDVQACRVASRGFDGLVKWAPRDPVQTVQSGASAPTQTVASAASSPLPF